MGTKAQRLRVLLCKWAMDAHDRGVRTVARSLMDAGVEVIFTRFELPAEVVRTAQDEDVDVIGVSCSMGEHCYFAPEILRLMREKGMGQVPLVFGGVIPLEDKEELLRLGVRAVFGPGSSVKAVCEYVSGLACTAMSREAR